MMRSFKWSAIALGVVATVATAAGAAPQSAQTGVSSEILRAAARTLVMPLIPQSKAQQVKLGSTAQSDLYAAAAMPKGCGKKNTTPPPKCPHVSPN